MQAVLFRCLSTGLSRGLCPSLDRSRTFVCLVLFASLLQIINPLTGLGIAVAYSANHILSHASHADQSPGNASINLTCSNKLLNISSDPSTWDHAFANATKVNLEIKPSLRDYKYAGNDNYGAVRIMCDSNKFYFLGEYTIPNVSNASGYKQIAFKTWLSTNDNNNPVPQKEDFIFEFDSMSLSAGMRYPGLAYLQGLNNSNAGLNGWSYPGTLAHNGLGVGYDSMMSTSLFQQVHPIYLMEISRSYNDSSINFRIENPFGLGFEMWDNNPVASDGSIYISFYPTHGLTHVYLQQQQDITTQTQTKTNSTSSTIPTSATSIPTVASLTTSTQVSQKISSGLGLSNLEIASLVGTVLVLGALGLYLRHRKSDN